MPGEETTTVLLNEITGLAASNKTMIVQRDPDVLCRVRNDLCRVGVVDRVSTGNAQSYNSHGVNINSQKIKQISAGSAAAGESPSIHHSGR